MQTDFLQFIFQAINNLLTQNLGFFDAMGQNLFRSFATILVVWYGVKSALSAASGRHLSISITLRASYSPSASASRWSITTALRSPASARASTISLPTRRSSSRIRSIRASCKPLSQRVADFESRMDSPGVADIPRNRHLRHRHHPARSSPGHRHRCHRLRIHRHCCLRSCGAGLHTVLYRPETGVALLGLVPLLHPICLLPGRRVSCCLRHRKSHARSSPPSARRARFPPSQLIGWFPVLFITFLASIYVLLKIPLLDQPHLQRHVRRLFRRDSGEDFLT